MQNQPDPPAIEQQREISQALRDLFVAADPQVAQLARMSDGELVRWSRQDRNRVLGLRHMATGSTQCVRGLLEVNEALFDIIERLQTQLTEQEAAIAAQRGRILNLEEQLNNREGQPDG